MFDIIVPVSPRTNRCPEKPGAAQTDVNLTGVFLCRQAELRQMVRQSSGVIVNTASIGGITGVNGPPSYVASQHGDGRLTRSIVCPRAKVGPSLGRALSI